MKDHVENNRTRLLPCNGGESAARPERSSKGGPNPFNPTTTISYDLSHSSLVRLTIYNILGEEVARLVDGAMQEPGNQSVSFNASNYPSGVYFYRLSAMGESGDNATDVEGNRGGTFTSVKKMILVK